MTAQKKKKIPYRSFTQATPCRYNIKNPTGTPMKIEHLTADIRPMSAYQAMELGFHVAREWYGNLWQMQAGTLKLLAVAMLMLFGFHYMSGGQSWLFVWFVILLISWLKPCFEMPMLAFLSQKLFDNQADKQAGYVVLQNARGLRWAFVIKHRFGTQRPIFMAIRLLEGQQGKYAKHRLKLLGRGTGNAMLIMSLMFGLAEMVLFFGGLGVLLSFFSSPYYDTSIGEWLLNSDNMPLWLSMLICGWYLVVVSVLSPFFVSAGFCVYLCRRSLLEGWDIELVFRRMAMRYKKLTETAHIKGSL